MIPAKGIEQQTFNIALGRVSAVSYHKEISFDTPLHRTKLITRLWKLNVNVYVYSLISRRVQQTSQFIPLVLDNSLIRSHLLWGEFSAFSAVKAIHNSPYLVPPGTYHCWVDRGGMI